MQLLKLKENQLPALYYKVFSYNEEKGLNRKDLNTDISDSGPHRRTL